LFSKHKARLAGRQVTGFVAGLVVGGPSLGLLAGMGDVYFNIEQLAIKNQLYFNTVDTSQRIIPQLPESVRANLANNLTNMINEFILGQSN